MTERTDPYRAAGALSDPGRRRLYDYVVSRSGPVSRDEAAAGADVPGHSARFHLDRLVEEGLLEVEFRRLTGRSGPGAGRPAKLYRRGSAEVRVVLPPRRYDLVGQVLAAAVQRSLDGAPLGESLTVEAHAAGRRDGAERAAGATGGLEAVAGVLGDRGFEPCSEVSGLVLRNCPFDALAREHTALVCGVNHDYVSGVVEGLRCPGARAVLDPAPDRCCVRVERGLSAR